MPRPHAKQPRSPGRGRDRGAHIQRDRLLTAMATIVGERGWQHTTLKEVVARARISRRTLYELYADKEECFLAACDVVTAGMVGMTTRAYRAEPSPRDGIDAALMTFLRYCANRPAIARMYLAEMSIAGPAATARWQAHMEEMASLTGCALVRVEPALPPHASTMVVGSVYTVARTRVLAGRASELPRLTPELTQAMWQLLGVE
jgi:AcrR family transcriptional regulator